MSCISTGSIFRFSGECKQSMALEDTEVRRFVAWRILPVALVIGAVWYCRRKGATFKKLRSKAVAILTAKVMRRVHKIPDIVTRKEKLFSILKDQKTSLNKRLKILEIGAGGGENFTFYPSGSQVICLDPNQNFENYLVQNAEKSNVEMTRFVKGFAEQMDSIEDNSIDAVVCAMVLCSVRDQRKSLSEVMRVLKPNGKFYFIEHVAAKKGTCLNRLQRWLNPFWFFLTRDCQLHRETAKAVDKAGFSETSMEHFTLKTKLIVIRPLLAGSATK